MLSYAINQPVNFFGAAGRAPLNLVQTHIRTLGCVYSITQAVMEQVAARFPKVSQYAYDIQIFFNSGTMDLFWLVTNTVQLANEISRCKGWTVVDPRRWHGLIVKREITSSQVGLLVSLAEAAVLTLALRRWRKRQENDSMELQKVIPLQNWKTDTASYSELIRGIVHSKSVRLFFNLSLALCSSDWKLFGVTVMAQAVSLYMHDNQVWVTLVRNGLSAIVEQRRLLVPASNSTDHCVICHKSNPESYFCDRHVVHNTCLVKEMSASWEKVSRESVKIPIEAFPACPACDAIPNNFVLRGKVKGELLLKRLDVYRHPKRRDPFKANRRVMTYIQFLEVGFYALLAHIKKTDLACSNGIFAAQSLLVLLESFFLLFSVLKLFVRLEKKNRDNPNYGLAFFAKLCGGVVAAAGAVWLINRSFRPRVNLNELVRDGLNLSPEQMKTFTLQWSSPTRWQKILQTIGLFRLGLEGVHILTSKHKVRHSILAGLQAFRMYSSFSEGHIVYEGIYKNPAPIPSESFYYRGKEIAESVYAAQARFGFQVPFRSPSWFTGACCDSERDHWQKIAISIHHTCQTAFVRSKWWYYNFNTPSYEVRFALNPPSCSCGQAPVWQSFIGHAFDKAASYLEGVASGKKPIQWANLWT